MTFDVLRPLIDQGLLPAFQASLTQAAWSPLLSTIPPFTAPAWTTFMTGMNPGWHGVTNFQRPRGDQCGFVDATQIKDTLWEMISRAGKQVIVVNVPLTYPPRPVNGVLISGMLTPSSASEFTYPPQVATELEDYIIDLDYLTDGEDFRQDVVHDRPHMLADLQHILERRTANLLRLMQTSPWDFCMTVFTCTDRVTHFFWDEIGELIEQGATSPVHEAILRFYKTLDQAVAQLIAAASAETTVIFMSDHGFGPAPTSYANLNVWLEQQGLLHARGGWRNSLTPQSLRLKLGRQSGLKRILRKLLPFGLQQKLRQAVADNLEENVIDWETTRAFIIPLYAYTCGIQLRPAAAGDDAVAEREKLCRTITSALPALTDPRTGRSIVRAVYRREEIYHGPYLESLPDVIVVLESEYAAMTSLADRSVVVPAAYRLRSGDHRDEGILMMHGPQIVPGRLATAPTLADLTPTILHLLNIPPSHPLDGRVLTEAFSTDWLQQHPLHAPQAAAVNAAPQRFEYTPEEQAAIRHRLEQLGYL